MLAAVPRRRAAPRNSVSNGSGASERWRAARRFSSTSCPSAAPSTSSGRRRRRRGRCPPPRRRRRAEAPPVPGAGDRARGARAASACSHIAQPLRSRGGGERRRRRRRTRSGGADVSANHCRPPRSPRRRAVPSHRAPLRAPPTAGSSPPSCSLRAPEAGPSTLQAAAALDHHLLQPSPLGLDLLQPQRALRHCLEDGPARAGVRLRRAARPAGRAGRTPSRLTGVLATGILLLAVDSSRRERHSLGTNTWHDASPQTEHEPCPLSGVNCVSPIRAAFLALALLHELRRGACYAALVAAALAGAGFVGYAIEASAPEAGRRRREPLARLRQVPP